MAKVYQKIAAVQAELAKSGIAKSGQNKQQGYNFRGIDQVYDALAPLLASHGLCILPRVIAREVVERAARGGGALFNVTVEVEFDFVAAEDGSTHVVKTFGEAMDSADKATNKAMSAAYKYAALMTFAIPTEGDNDADATTHEVDNTPKQGMPDAEFAKLQQTAKASSTTSQELCKKFGVNNLRLLTPDQFGEAIGYMNDKIAAKVKAENNSLADELDDEIPGFD